jgi:hypothetical protein
VHCKMALVIAIKYICSPTYQRWMPCMVSFPVTPELSMSRRISRYVKVCITAKHSANAAPQRAAGDDKVQLMPQYRCFSLRPACILQLLPYDRYLFLAAQVPQIPPRNLPSNLNKDYTQHNRPGNCAPTFHPSAMSCRTVHHVSAVLTQREVNILIVQATLDALVFCPGPENPWSCKCPWTMICVHTCDQLVYQQTQTASCARRSANRRLRQPDAHHRGRKK